LDSIVTPGRKKRRPNFSPEFRKALAQRACEPGVSVSRLAQENDVNVNMVFKWRRYLLAGKFDNAVRQQTRLPVMIADAPETAGSSTKLKQPEASAAAVDSGLPQQGIIEIRIADATVRFDGQADLATLRAVVRMLRP
jgi:transposase